MGKIFNYCAFLPCLFVCCVYSHPGNNKIRNFIRRGKQMQISAKLNPEFDQELIDAIKKIPKRERSYTYREALKKYFKDKENTK